MANGTVESNTGITAALSGAPASRWSRATRAWPILLFMILSFGGSGAFSPYLQLNFQQRGLSAEAIGLLTGIGPALGIVMPLLWGYAGDSTGRVKRLLALTSVAAAASFMVMSLPLEFAGLMIAAALFNAFSQSGGPLGAALILGEAERLKTDFGSLRMWGSVGFAAGILFAGRLISGFGTVSIFAIYSVLVVLSLIPLAWVREAAFRGRALDVAKIRQVLRHRGLQGLLAVSFLWRVTAAAYYTFFTIYITGMGASPTLVSIAWATALVGEVTILRLSGRIARRIGVRGLLVLGLGGSAIRWAIYAAVPSPEWAIPFQLLHGLTFGCTTTATVLAVDRIFPTELRSTGQGLLGIVMWGLGGVVGSLAVGALAGPIGYRGLFAVSGIGAALTVLLMVVVMRRGAGRGASAEEAAVIR
ncbi:MAG: MFS transporter [Anaerolineae bacterium]